MSYSAVPFAEVLAAAAQARLDNQLAHTRLQQERRQALQDAAAEADAELERHGRISWPDHLLYLSQTYGTVKLSVLAQHLTELTGLDVSENVISQICQRYGIAKKRGPKKPA